MPTIFGPLIAAILLTLCLNGRSEAADWALIGGLYFTAGERIAIDHRGEDDIFAAGADVQFDGASGDHLFAAGGHVGFRGVAARDVIAAGGSVILAGTVADDALLAGGAVRLTKDAAVGDAVVAAGREINLDGRVGGDAWAAGRSVIIAGEIAGDLHVEAERIVIAPAARIGGNLVYRSDREATIASGAAIVGEVQHLRRETRYGRWPGAVARWTAVLAVFLGAAGLAAVLQGALPRLMATGAATVAIHPWASLGIGFAVLVASPVAVALLAGTVIGIPVALVVLGAYFTILVPAVVVFGYWLGAAIGRLLGRPARERRWLARFAWTSVGLAILAAIALVPWVGGAALLIALLFGLGALVIALARHLGRPVEALPPA
ncbi:MAG: polymer-forming cytoskeletal protein [Rhodospirillales bacterium]|nr:polymer-forming cytoskeletal protein [Rhodospirillales bacterium]